MKKVIDGVEYDLTTAELGAYNLKQEQYEQERSIFEQKAQRYRRDMLLNESDWTQMPDYNGAGKAAWATYRQALRDITLQEGFPENVVWPEKPE